MDRKIVQKIKTIAKNDFNTIEENLKKKNSDITASIDDMKFSIKRDRVEATCRFQDSESLDAIEASINYSTDSRGVFADANVKDVSTAILSAMTTIIAADDEDAMGFDDPEFDNFDDFDEEFTGEDDFVVDGDLSLDEEEEYEDPESDPDIETDNNIEGHYIAECDRCHGIFISALVESDQQVEYISGICPLCEKESDQYIKWIIKPVETA